MFNVDGSSRGNPRQASIGDAIRDSKGLATAYSLSQKGFAIPTLLRFWQSEGLWSCVTLSLFSIIGTSSFLMESLISTVHDTRAYNAFVDNLAKQGSSMDGEFLHCGDLKFVVVLVSLAGFLWLQATFPLFLLLVVRSSFIDWLISWTNHILGFDVRVA
ncbi:hypothetical protein Q3G72_018606 [Acer saccharum]|nr:hypothetical protein Q3G72_018606 [Acer saccharum]